MGEQGQQLSGAQTSIVTERYILDAGAFIAFFNNESGAEKTEQLIKRARAKEVLLYASSINVYEVYYDALRGGALEKAEELLKEIYALPLIIVEIIDRTMMRHAAHFKTAYKMSVADSFALALAKQMNARVVSTDHHEFDTVEKSGEVQFFWIR
jgi:predicted nucleic acid-binding protein